MPNLSVNINKIALLRNARGGNVPDLLAFAQDCERYGADGITIHPRPDQRHITQKDVYALKEVVKTEFNIEGYPSDDFLKMVVAIKPHQCTLVPDSPDQLTSDHGWDTVSEQERLKKMVGDLQDKEIRVSLFIDPVEKLLAAAATTKVERIEFYTGPYAHDFTKDKNAAISDFAEAAKICAQLKLGINAGHDLNLQNLAFFSQHIDGLLEVSIGHALVNDCLYLGLENTIQLYKRALNVGEKI